MALYIIPHSLYIYNVSFLYGLKWAITAYITLYTTRARNGKKWKRQGVYRWRVPWAAVVGELLWSFGDPVRRSGWDRWRSMARGVVQCDGSGTERGREGERQKARYLPVVARGGYAEYRHVAESGFYGLF